MKLSELLFNTHLDIGKNTNSSILNVCIRKLNAGETHKGKKTLSKEGRKYCKLPSIETGVIHNYFTPLSFYTLKQLLGFY